MITLSGDGPVDGEVLLPMLALPFTASSIGWKAQATTKDKTRALAVPYIDARDVMDRLDTVLGPWNWQDAYRVLPNGAVLCRLSIRCYGEWIHKSDVGGQSDQEDAGDKLKAAFSDSLKRAGVRWGIGRYLYRVPTTWVPYDQERRQLREIPELPAWALPPALKAKPKPEGSNGAALPPGLPVVGLPRSGMELIRRLRDYDAQLSKAGVCQAGDLLDAIDQYGQGEGLGEDVSKWPVEQYAGVAAFVATWQRKRSE